MKAYVVTPRGTRWTARPTVNPGRSDADEEPAIETGVLAQRRLVTPFGIVQHRTIVTLAVTLHWRESDMLLRRATGAESAAVVIEPVLSDGTDGSARPSFDSVAMPG